MAYLTLNFKSTTQFKSTTARIILPDGWLQAGTEPLKTFYFFTGFSADSTEMVTYLSFRRQAELKNMAVVLIDGENSFYQDHPMRLRNYGSYVGQEIVDVTRKLFPLSTKREDTYVGGISMGGFGALLIGLKYSGTFSKVAALSPAVNCYRIMDEYPDAGFNPIMLENIFGSREEFLASDNNLLAAYEKADKDKMPDLLVCCGEQDRLVYPQGREFAEELAAKGYRCRYIGGNGDHETDYWERMMDPMFSFLAGIPDGSRNDILQIMGTAQKIPGTE